jgi:hypothetical protein
VIRRRKASKERKLAAHRKSLHGRKVHEVMALGNTIILEKISYKAWQKQFGTSVGLRAPGMFVAILRRTVASTGGILVARSHTHHGAEPVVPWLWQATEEGALRAVAPVRVWRGSRAT